MAKKELPSIGGQSFENLKQVNDHGAEYWSARDLQPLLGYSQWRRFEDAINRAITSCEQSGNNSEHHFAGAGKPITGGKGAVQVVQDYQLSRFACYLIARTATRASRKSPKPRNTSPSRPGARNCPSSSPRIWNVWNCANRPQKNSRRYPAPPDRPACKTACSVFFTTPATKAFTEAWVMNKSRPERVSQPKSN